MAEYTIPKPYRDFYVTNPAVETLERVQLIEEGALPKSDLMSSSTIIGMNTLEGREIEVSVKNDNIIGYPYQNNSYTRGDVSFTAQTDGGITLSGTPTEAIGMNIVRQLPLNQNSYYVVGLTGEYENAVISYNLTDSSGKSVLNNQTNPTTGNVVTLDLNEYPTATMISLDIKRSSNNVAMSGTAYPFLKLADGTETTVYATGKNLLNPTVRDKFLNTNYSQIAETITVKNANSSTTAFVELWLKGLQPNSSYTLSFNANIDTQGKIDCTIYNGRITDASPTFIAGATLNETLNKYIATFTTPSNPNRLVVRLFSLNGTYYEDASVTYSSIQLEKGTTVTDYEPYHGQEISCQVGDTIRVEQYNDYTCISCNNIHVTLSAQFVEKVEELLNEKATVLIGLFASRPTDTVDYPRIYVATDKTDTDRTTLLQANQSGATASNWIYI